MIDDPKIDDTRTKLLEAAEEVFAEKGFRSATVREILDRAGAKNIAAINYHFGDKETLYIESVKFAHRHCTSGVPFPDWPEGTPPESKLRDFVRTMMLRIFQNQRPCSFQLMLRELAEPTQACREVVVEYIQPMARLLDSILAELMPGISNPERFMFGCSVVGQCIFYKTNKPFLMYLMGPEEFARLSAEEIAEHIANFTLAGILGQARRGTP
jgi:AcrR family transcriptional regulator